MKGWSVRPSGGAWRSPTVGRSRADLVAPVVQGILAGLSIEHAEVFLGDDPIWRDYESDGDAGAYGSRWAAFFRASVLPTLALDLDGGADDPRYAEFTTRMEAGMARRLAANPEPVVIPLATVVICKGDAEGK